MLHVHITLQSREFSIQNPILHAEDKELFEYYITGSRNSTHRRQGDLLEIHPCVLQDLPVTFQAVQPQVLTKATPVTPVTPETFQSFQTFQTFQSFQSFQTFQSFQAFRTFQSFMTFQPFQAILQILQCSSISRESTPFQHSPIRMHILQFDWFPQKTPPSTSWAITDIHSSKKGRCCDIGQIDRFSIIELFPLSSCQVIILIARMTFNCSTSCLMS